MLALTAVLAFEQLYLGWMDGNRVRPIRLFEKVIGSVSPTQWLNDYFTFLHPKTLLRRLGLTFLRKPNAVVYEKCGICDSSMAES